MDDIDRYYEILELKFGASPEEVKRAYRDLVRVWHPDRFSHDPRLQQKAQEKLKEINEAYEKLQAFLSGQRARAYRSGSRPSQSRPHSESGGARSGDSGAAPEPPPEAERTRENSTASSAGIWSAIIAWLRYEYDLMPRVVKIGVVAVLLLIAITSTQNIRSKQTLPEPRKTPLVASAPKLLSDPQSTVARSGRKPGSEDQAARPPSLADRYPKLAAFVAKARAEGYSDQEIDDFVREKFIVPALKEGYSAQEVNEYLGWKEAPARNKATAKLEAPPATRERAAEHAVSAARASGGPDRSESLLSNLSPEDQEWVNRSCPKSLGASLWTNCIRREVSTLSRGRPDLSNLNLDERNWVLRSCPSSLGPSLAIACLNRELQALATGMPDLSALGADERAWVQRSCPQSLGPSLYRSCISREATAVTGGTR